MAITKNEFASMVASPKELKGIVRGPCRKLAIWYCGVCYRNGMSAEELADTVKRDYGSVIALFIIEAFVGGIISWAAQKLMEWLTDRRKRLGALGSNNCNAVLAEVRCTQWEQER